MDAHPSFLPYQLCTWAGYLTPWSLIRILSEGLRRGCQGMNCIKPLVPYLGVVGIVIPTCVCILILPLSFPSVVQA